MDYEKLGLKAGIEIHQQLDTAEKLFCRCPTTLRDVSERTGEFHRYLRATESELGEIDRAAREEMKLVRKFCYYTYDTVCLVEHDEEPPAPMNPEALEICLTIAKMLGMTPVEQVHTMRKLVIDGSNTSGFQRTALVALSGALPGGCRVETICLEEEAAQRVEDETFSLDRLGIPLVEITTAPCMHTPEAVQEVAGHIGMVLRSTGRVKRGLGTIRQDINVSIADGARVEIKGVQDLDLIAEVVRREAGRQTNLLAIRDELRERGARVDHTVIDATSLFAQTKSSILKKAKTVLAVRLCGFAGLVGREIQPGRRLGSEMSDYAKKCGVGGIFHTDELPAYGVTAEEVAHLREFVGAAEEDCVVIVAATRQRAGCAAEQVMIRAEMAIAGVPEETRKMLEEGSTAYMRPLPGAARMYPETDVFEVTIDDALWESIKVPELLTDRTERFVREFGLDEGLARQVAFSERLALFEKAVAAGVRPTLAARTLLGTCRELARDGVDVGRVSEEEILALLLAVEAGRAAKEAIPDLLTELARTAGDAGAPGERVEAAIGKMGPAVSQADVEEIVRRIVAEREAFAREKGMGALGPLMGVVMQELRGSVDGKVISETLRRELQRLLS
ncbi:MULTISPECIES: Glu-tRNA(Gln) amidotransferase subunit GatE [Methanoculleus]|uniref:Glutamyl-tRNA(Gln) amidotransferase subunit E n=2 Tax=Methanoculleus TaxID=45989 RepID=A3CTT7_METMJ|nr:MULTISPECIES: Glu-tRNA(Gln) amidotransferase subunit GatE [Methanoculleus]ABN56787.1 glutamyl-tRNA(Gln) amidotransferase subunit E [Methanoculleus marisnigri JR1]MCC7556412.1 Glu-tRNA(Gln) amidotransferase subunit GatE [Methanoculleus marisnigri]UYU19750.1 Glu-tRNA(Gln) amidotransferase subunit GatE [Methanoculleus submarinus]